MNIKSYEFYQNLRSLPFIDGIWLYGSRARNDAQSRSDIDLAILCPRATQEQWDEIKKIIDDADILLKIDLVRFDELSSNDKIKENILQDKQVLFERKNVPDLKWYDSFLYLGEALDQLEEMVNIPENTNSYVRDATIQRFEFCTELFWKVLKKICIHEKFEVTSPKSTLQKSYEAGLIDDEDAWLSMLDDRNETSHTYQKKVAIRIYYKIRFYYEIMRSTYNKIGERYKLL